MRIQETSKQIEKIIVEAFEGDVRIGAASALIDLKPTGKPAVLLEDVEVEEEYRQQGVGRALVQHIVKLAVEFGCYKVVLQCSIHNIPFYEKCGFRIWENGMRIDVS